MKRIIITLGIIIFLASCTSLTSPKDCGSEVNPGAANREGRECFYSAYQYCRPASFHVGYRTLEGMDRHELTIVGEKNGVCKVKHIAEIKYIDTTYLSTCSLQLEEQGKQLRFQLFDCEGEETVGLV